MNIKQLKIKIDVIYKPITEKSFLKLLLHKMNATSQEAFDESDFAIHCTCAFIRGKTYQPPWVFTFIRGKTYQPPRVFTFIRGKTYQPPRVFTLV